MKGEKGAVGFTGNKGSQGFKGELESHTTECNNYIAVCSYSPVECHTTKYITH